jgi:hypothetical protein
MKKKLMVIELIVVTGGTIFAWANVIKEFLDYCEPCGHGTNPVTTPCFYGAIGFTVVLILSAIILYLEYKEK